MMTNSVFKMLISASIIPPTTTIKNYDPIMMWITAVKRSYQETEKRVSQDKAKVPINPIKTRPSVIKPNSSQFTYNVPVSNQFETLGN